MVDPVSIGYVIERSAKDRLDRIAEHSNVSSAVMFEQMVANTPLTDRGVPAWWPEPELKDGELPIDTA
ncbi:putative transcriptional regulator [Pseudarthrobacter oxydans]|jgi:hypothetical protein|uniref:hypothetical protein n=1 Tax=Micrococcaceae TaxID=1268 RepID=UPI001D175210|nr:MULTISPECIES: hypothetical protein [Micrococcaceae]MDR6794857.1 putative transcriptional regulator [Pseudarthrobacter oxydans]